MATTSTHLLARQLRHLANGPAADSELLERFALRGDEAAFEALLRRHGSMVLGVCRRLLGDWHAAEDCFQAVFVVLARQARSLRQPEALAAWLYGVALRTARKVRAQEARRRVCERRSARPLVAEPPDDFLWRDLRALLDEAIALLPEKYRLPFVLHHLEGLTVAQAAQRLGCPVGTVAARLARARDQLRRRLVRRGLVLSAGALTAALADNVALARVAPPLLASTLTAAASVAAVPVAIAILAQGVLKTMTMTKLKAAAALVLVLALLSGSAAWLARPLPAAPPTRQSPVNRNKPQDRERIQGEWTVLSEIQEGKDITEGKSTTLVFTGETLTFRDNDKESCKASFDLCSLTKPGRIDVVFTKEGWSLLGIYRLEGNLLTLCLAVPGTLRPTTFESRPASHRVLFVLKRRSPVTRTGNPRFGTGVNSNAGVTGSISLNERNFETFRFPASLTQPLGGTAFRGAGQESRLEAVPATQLQRYTRPIAPGTSSIEYTVPFVDSGTVDRPSSSKEQRGSAGAGVHFTLPGIGPVPKALDFGFPILKGEKVFSFWMGFFR